MTGPDIKLAARHHRERHKRYELPGEPVIDADVTWEQIKATTNGACVIHGCTDEASQVGHLRSVATGGAFTLDNLRPICPQHNRIIGPANITDDMIDGGEIENGEQLLQDAVAEKMMTAGVDRTGALVSTLYALASWHTESFVQVGISAYTGPSGSGKSTCMKIDAAVGRTQDGQPLATMPSDAVLRDLLDAGHLVVLDEIKKPSDLVTAMLNSGYDRDQSTMRIKVADGRGGFHDVKIDLFGSRVVGGVYLSLAPDTMTRVIETRLSIVPHDPHAPKGWAATRRREALRERAIRWARQTRGAIPRFDLRELPEHVNGRHEEIWGPLIKTADIINEQLGKEVRVIAEKHASEHRAEAPKSAHTVWHTCRIYAEALRSGELETPGAIRSAYILTELQEDPDLPEYDRKDFGPKHLWGHMRDWKAIPKRDASNRSVYMWENWQNPAGTKTGGGLRQALNEVLDKYPDDLPAVVVIE